MLVAPHPPGGAAEVTRCLLRAQVLRQVYANHTNIDDDLVKSIALPADDPNAGEIFYRVIAGWGGKGTPVNELLGQIQVHLQLLWWQCM